MGYFVSSKERARQGLVAKLAHSRTERLRGEKAVQHTPEPTLRADIRFRPRPLAPGIDVLKHLLNKREVSPRGMPDGADVAASRLTGRYHILLRAGR